MSIEKVKMFTVICDNCKESADEGTDYSCWNDENGAKDVAMEAGFINEDENHYCPKCYNYNDDDELMIDKKRFVDTIKNNGWIKIESEADLPKNGYYEVVVRGTGEITRASLDNEYRTKSLVTYYSHYQPIQKPQPPIY